MPQSKTSANIAFWMNACRSHMPAALRYKQAELGGDGQDIPFEQAFSNLAHAYLRSEAPTLLDHELGFQLIDRNQENTKAVGIFVFKVGSQQLMAPMFFLRGELKGHELLYMKDQDMFVPMKENWLNYLLNRKPNIIGTGVDRQTSRLGVRYPDLQALSIPKYAAVHDYLPLYGHLTTADVADAVNDLAEHCQTKLDLSHFLKQASLPALESVVTMLQHRPKIAAAFDAWHGMDTLTTAIKEAKVRALSSSILDDPYKSVSNYQKPITGSLIDAVEQEKRAASVMRVSFLTFDDVRNSSRDLSDLEKQKLFKDELLVQDDRLDDEVSIVAENTDGADDVSLINPSETGIYDVLVDGNKFKKCLVLYRPYAGKRLAPICTLISLTGEKDWGNFKPGDVWVKPEQPEEWKDWFDSQASGSIADTGYRYVVVTSTKQAVCPFRVDYATGDGYKVWYYNEQTSYCSPCDYDSNKQYYTDSPNGPDIIYPDAKSGVTLHVNGNATYLPKDAVVIKLAGQRDYENSMIVPGRIIDHTIGTLAKTAELRVRDKGASYSINGKEFRPVPALIHLIRDHGLREEAGRQLLKQAAVTNRRMTGDYVAHVKYANPYLTDQGPMAPPFPEPQMTGQGPLGFQGQTQMFQQDVLPVEGLAASQSDLTGYDVTQPPETPMDASDVAQAAATGQKEIFDTAMIGTMLRSVRDDTMIDRYLPDLVKGMDKLGRILFMFYWHQDKFADRYGKQDLPELEDSLRNAFEMLGDVTLFLKQKTIEPYPEEDIRDLDLGDVAEV